jgi:dTDP-4-dehydrorhamnose reductase
MRRVLITGGAGLLGRALIRHAPAGWELHSTRRVQAVGGAPAHDVELSHPDAVARLFAGVRPQLVFHTAYSMQHGERDIVAATRNVVTECVSQGCRLVHLSTDLVFDGEHGPYDESAMPAPISEYGRCKARAEAEVRTRLPEAAIIRTSLVTEAEPPDPRVAWVTDHLRRGDPLTLYVDELRCPIPAADLAAQLWEIAALPEREAAGVWHLAGPEAVSRYALGLLIAARFGLDAACITPGRSRDAVPARPRDVRLLTLRADCVLGCRARPISELFAGAAPAPYPCAP